MERLTKRDEFGNADIIGVDCADLQLNLSFEEFNKVTEALNKLAKYEELEQQRKLANPREIKENILGRMSEFIEEYCDCCKSPIDCYGVRIDTMKRAIQIVKAGFAGI